MDVKQLKIYGRSSRTRQMEPRITFSKSGAIKLNKAAVQLMKLKEASFHLAIGQDERNPEDWYVIKGTSKEWSKPRFQKNGDVIFNHAQATYDLLKSVGETRSSQSYYLDPGEDNQPSSCIAIFTRKPLLS